MRDTRADERTEVMTEHKAKLETENRMSDKMPELLPCPFCNDAGYIQHESTGGHSYFNVSCLTEDCRGYSDESPFFKREDAIKAWNTRSTHPAPDLRKAIEAAEYGADCLELLSIIHHSGECAADAKYIRSILDGLLLRCAV